jgi:hypothetical protein
LEATKLARSAELRRHVGESALVLVVRLLLLILVIRVFFLLVIVGILVLVIVVTGLVITGLIVARLVIAGLVVTIRAFSGSLSRLLDNLRLSRSIRSISGSGRCGRSSSRIARSSASTSTGITGANLLRLAAVSDTLEGDALLGYIGDLDARDLGGVAHVGVDTHKHLSVAGGTSRDLDVASRHLLAVTAAAVELAKVGNLEVLDDNGTTTVVLNDLVFGTSGTSAVDGGGLAVLLLLDREGIFTDGVPDNIVQGATTVAVNTLNLVRTCNS